MSLALLFPPPPRGLRGRTAELRALTLALSAKKAKRRPNKKRPDNTAKKAAEPPTNMTGQNAGQRLALIGAGGSGKSVLACALGHRLRPQHPGGIHWFRSGAWDHRTVLDMLALRFGTPRTGGWAAVASNLRQHLAGRGATLIVLDNHEDDRAAARLLELLRGPPVTWIITARRCLLSGVTVYPVIAPLIRSRENAFPRVARLTEMLRWNPLALDLADGLVASHRVSVAALARHLRNHGIDRVHVVAHEDDVPEVRVLVDYLWAGLSSDARRILALLAHIAGDHADEASVAALTCGARRAKRAFAALKRDRLVQQPLPGRYTLHAVVRYIVAGRTRFSQRRIFTHYMRLLETFPERFDLEQTHLFGAMDYAQSLSDQRTILRVHDLTERLAG